MEFVEYLKEQRPGKRFAIFGDGASYHNSQEFRELLTLIKSRKTRIKIVDKLSKICSECPRTKPCRRYLVTKEKFYDCILSCLQFFSNS